MKKILFLFSLMFLVACGNKTKQPPVSLLTEDGDGVVKIEYEQKHGVKIIPVKLNGVPVQMIYDTGCSGVHISLLELQLLAKQGCFSDQDFLGTSCSLIADGSVVENAEILLHSVEIAPDLVLTNVRATVALNQNAPLLLGDEVLDKIASKVEVDNIAKTINFTKW